MGKKTIAKILNLQANELQSKYYNIFENVIREKYKNSEPPLNWVCFTNFIGYKNVFSPDEEKRVYERCIKENKPWQEYPDIVKRISNWYSEVITEIKKNKNRII